MTRAGGRAEVAQIIFDLIRVNTPTRLCKLDARRREVLGGTRQLTRAPVRRWQRTFEIVANEKLPWKGSRDVVGVDAYPRGECCHKQDEAREADTRSACHRELADQRALSRDHK
jgi:hypothetical protein